MNKKNKKMNKINKLRDPLQTWSMWKIETFYKNVFVGDAIFISDLCSYRGCAVFRLGQHMTYKFRVVCNSTRVGQQVALHYIRFLILSHIFG